jgi:FkbM family methyltransferase
VHLKKRQGVYWPDAQKDGAQDLRPAMLDAALGACGSLRVAVDGGAYVGLWTLPLMRAFGRVVAFEPMPANLECLVRNCPGVDARGLALSVVDGEDELRGDPAKAVGWSLVRDGGAGVVVGTVRLDSVGLDRLDLLKLDVEGSEYRALLGAERSVREYRPVVVIEEKLDPARRASRLLERWGMHLVLEIKHDRLYAWR